MCSYFFGIGDKRLTILKTIVEGLSFRDYPNSKSRQVKSVKAGGLMKL